MDLNISVKHGAQVYELAIRSTSKVTDLMDRVQQLTEVHPRGQKLIVKGKILTAEMTLGDAGVVSGSKIMLIAAQGNARSALNSLKPAPRSVVKNGPLPPPKVSLSQSQARVESWSKTRIVSLRESGLKQVPDAVWKVGEGARVLDLGSNSLEEIPENISLLLRLERLRLAGNQLTRSRIAWRGLCSLNHLSILSLDHNNIESLPPEIGGLQKLQFLSANHNELVSLPDEIGTLSELKRLELSHNRLSSLTDTLGSCRALQEVNLSANRLSVIPSSFGELVKLKVLMLDSNALSSLPSALLIGCVELCTLLVHGNPVTVEELRQVEGWREFDERRKGKYGKQLQFGVMGSSSGFDEGADAQRWSHF